MVIALSYTVFQAGDGSKPLDKDTQSLAANGLEPHEANFLPQAFIALMNGQVWRR
jgi:hypothetical protein